MLRRLKSVLNDQPQKIRSVWTNQQPEFTRFSIGDWTYGSPTVKEWKQDAKLVIGKYCSIAEHSTILLGGEHRTDWLTTFPFAELLQPTPEAPLIGYSKGDVTIENDVWIGYGATILSGVTIGSGAVIGAGSVVAKNVEPYSIVVGNPARHLRFRLAESLIPQMLKIAWWSWPHQDVLAAAPLLLSKNVEEFIRIYGSNKAKP
jgi:acetyltransferase-like isoleucine patch superfamily enzyme